jgi:hypothetical protein
LIVYLWKGRVRVQPTPFGKGTGLLLTVATILLLVLVAWVPRGSEDLILVLRRLLTLLLALSVLHVLAIGAINLGRPAPFAGTNAGRAPSRSKARDGREGGDA